MEDAALRQRNCTRQQSCFDDAVRLMGYRDCAREAVRFLTEQARLDPSSDVVLGIGALLNRPADTSRDPHAAAGCPAMWYIWKLLIILELAYTAITSGVFWEQWAIPPPHLA